MPSMPIPPTSQSFGSNQNLWVPGAIHASIGNGNFGSVGEQPFADYPRTVSTGSRLSHCQSNLNPLMNQQASYHGSRTESGNNWLYRRELHQLVEQPSGRVLQEWETGLESNSRYGRESQWKWNSHNYFMNHGGYFSTNR